MNNLRPLRKYQHVARNFLRKRKGCALMSMDPGTGKTIPAKRSAVAPALVICRRDDFLTWRLELTAEGVEERLIHMIDRGNAVLPPVHADQSHLPYGPVFAKWFLVTYDLVKNPRIYQWIRESRFVTVIADECHLIGHWESERTKKVIAATRHIPRRLGLTGSLIGNDFKTVWSQAMFVDNGETFTDNPYKFLNRYFQKVDHQWYPYKTAKEQIRKALRKIAFGVKLDDVAKLPPVRSFVKAVGMTPQQTEMQEMLIHDWEIDWGNGVIMEIDYVIARLQKLRQIASGFLYDENHKATWISDHKQRTVLQYTHDHPWFKDKPKIVIWCAHTAEIIMYGDLIPKKERVLFTGKMSRRDREEARIRFKGDDKVRYFIGQVDAGVGMNELVVADTAFYSSNSQRVISKVQSRARTRRLGSERHKVITYGEWVAEGSIEVKMLKTLGKQIDLAEYILSGIRQGEPIRKLLKA